MQRCLMRRYLTIEIAATHITAAKSRAQEFAYLGMRFELNPSSKKPVLDNLFVPNVYSHLCN